MRDGGGGGGRLLVMTKQIRAALFLAFSCFSFFAFADDAALHRVGDIFLV